MKAVVMEKSGKINIVLCSDGVFRKVKGDYEIGQTLHLNSSDFIGANRYSNLAILSGLAASVAVFFGGLFYETSLPCAYVTLDAEPSIEYSLNRLNRILDVKALNESAEPIVETLKKDGIKNDSLTEAINMTVVVLKENDYLSDNENEVVIGVVSNDEKRRQQLAGEVENSDVSNDKAISVSVLHTEKEERVAAISNGVSAGKYKQTQKSSSSSASTAATTAPMASGKTTASASTAVKHSSVPTTVPSTYSAPASNESDNSQTVASSKPSSSSSSGKKAKKKKVSKDKTTETSQTDNPSAASSEDGSTAASSAESSAAVAASEANSADTTLAAATDISSDVPPVPPAPTDEGSSNNSGETPSDAPATETSSDNGGETPPAPTPPPAEDPVVPADDGGGDDSSDLNGTNNPAPDPAVPDDGAYNGDSIDDNEESEENEDSSSYGSDINADIFKEDL